jgi:AAA-like domain/PD-(D/E)XK nuclease superfamily
MSKEFNITGKCIPALHYMADVSGKYAAVMDMIQKGRYFIINRPRQYGKTTMIDQLERKLTQSGDYIVIDLSFEGVGDNPFSTEAIFIQKFLDWLARDLKSKAPLLSEWMTEQKALTHDLDGLADAIANFVKKAQKKTVLFIDEVDKSSNNQLFLSFLGMLRDKYLDRDKTPTFHAVVLAGVHDIKTLKLKLRPGAEAKLNSPWNIAADFEVDMNLRPFEIIPMLEEYAADRGVRLDTAEIAEGLFYYTSGQPFLVSKLCKIFDEKQLPEKAEKTWTTEDIETAVNQLIGESNTNFDELTKNIDNNDDLYQLTYRVVIDAEQIPFVLSDPTIKLGVIYGFFSGNHRLMIHNRIYREHIAAHLGSRLLTSSRAPKTLTQNSGTYAYADQRLDMEQVLKRFQDLMREEYSKKDRDFLERQGRLVFLAFLKSVLNGHGYAMKEPQISEEKRLDVLITYHHHKYVVELKIWRGLKAHKAGLEQLTDYLERQGLDTGYLIVFDHSEAKEWKTQRVRTKGKRILAAWV